VLLQCREPEERPQNNGDPIGRPAFQETFAVYQPYASNFKNAQDLAIEEKAKLEKKPHPVYDQLNAFLIKPIQRVTKYPLLLRVRVFVRYFRLLRDLMCFVGFNKANRSPRS